MNKTVFAFCLLSSSFCLASTNGYNLKMDLSLNGKHVSSPSLMTKAGQKATVTQKTDSGQTFIEVVANEGIKKGNRGVLMKFVVGMISKSGKRTILSRPQILARENQPAEIVVSKGSESKPEVALSVIVQRRQL